ncbi:hypothetical protein K458DRAFT_315793 [Lentithecium fluviatile CBS 122367]|uniref:MARVEL domain-containing protein n=1 Tax=Lentithecium fluviatile CBS 122367 TaxID=1168545 RepID=A0A6G1ILU4_9PLEO|nr:hypothetical protein K458DRAFT_315793 [Lentithecium fluviatile CBS 122367]
MLRSPFLIFFVITIIELILFIMLLSLFACAYLDRFRTALWKDGGSKGWNSDPHQRVYFYANYREAPPIPLIWDESSTLCNLCIALLTFIFWIIRFNVNLLSGKSWDLYSTIMTNALYDGILIALWVYSATVQSSGDFSDPQHISLRPWYLDHACDLASPKNWSACATVKASYVFSVFAV